MIFLDIVLLIAGFFVLTKSASVAIKHLVRLSRYFGLSEFVISFTVVGIVAVFPELSIGINAAIEGVPQFGLGIIFGSNIADLTLVVGLVALTGGIHLRNTTTHHVRWAIVAVLLPVLLLLDGQISRLDSLLLLSAFAVYVFHMFTLRSPTKPSIKRETIHFKQEIPLILISLFLLLLAGKIITEAAEDISALLGLPVLFIGLLIAVGTCLPELTFAIQASRMKHSELGFGDIMGNVLADCLATLGIIGLIQPITPSYHGMVLVSGGFMIIAMAIILFLLQRNNTLSKKHGIFLVLLYAVFVILESLIERIVVS